MVSFRGAYEPITMHDEPGGPQRAADDQIGVAEKLKIGMHVTAIIPMTDKSARPIRHWTNVIQGEITRIPNKAMEPTVIGSICIQGFDGLRTTFNEMRFLNEDVTLHHLPEEEAIALRHM